MNATQVVKQSWQKVFGAGTGSDRPRPGDASHGTILYVEDITVRLKSSEPSSPRFAAPAEGLSLIRVRY